MTTKEFIEKAIEGGWQKYTPHDITNTYVLLADRTTKVYFGDLFLDPKAWEAVGKVEEWNYFTNGCPTCDYIAYYDEPEWQYRMHKMIDHLIEGGTITSYLEKL